MNKLHWFESKQLDRVTNFSTEIEPLRYAWIHNIKAMYYCTFANEKRYFGLNESISYLGFFKNKFAKAIEFQLLVIIKSVAIVLAEKASVIMVNQALIRHMLPALIINKVLRRRNRFIADIRTTPTSPSTFKPDMRAFHRQFKIAIKYFHGFSFITPFMEKYVLDFYEHRPYKTVIWSSGVNPSLFDPERYKLARDEGTFKLFYHGGISLSRGSMDLIKAVQSLVETGYNIELTQVGILVDPIIKEYCNENNRSSWCKLLAPVDIDRIPQIIADSDLPVLPFPDFMAWRVSSPIKLMEYLAMGKKVLVPNMECFTDVFGSRTDMVFYYDTKNENPVSAIADAIKHILDKKLLVNGNFFPEIRKFAIENYTWEKQAAKLFDFCENL